MKDKTHEMNRGYDKGEAEEGFEVCADSVGGLFQRRNYKNRQLRCAGLAGNEKVEELENYPEAGDTDVGDASDNTFGGFLPRTNWQDRF